MMVYVSEYISFLMIKMVDRGFKLYNPEYTNLTFYYFYLRIIFVFSKTQRQYLGSR